MFVSCFELMIYNVKLNGAFKNKTTCTRCKMCNKVSQALNHQFFFI